MQLWIRAFWLCLGIFLQPGVHAAAFEDSMAQRTLACTACHGLQGQAGPDGYYPRLAGKPAQYLYNQLRNFRSDSRHYPLMAGLLDALDENYLHAMADYFSALSVPYPAPAPAGTAGTAMERGRQLVHSGDPALGLPACTQCHGQQLTGMLPATPGLLGLPADYINAQLGGWQSGQRHATAPDCMAKIARQLLPRDSSAIARWLAAQPVPAQAHAVQRPASTKPGTLQCGSDAVAPAVASTAEAGTSTATAASGPVARGAYLARIGNCALCHSARGGMAYAGGRAVDTPFGAVFSSNITSDPVHGIGGWSADNFWHALHEGVSQDGHLLYPAFPYTSYTRISRADADDLFAFLQTVPPSPRPRQAHGLRWPYGMQAALRLWRNLFFTPGPVPPQAGGERAQDDAVWQRGQYLVQGLGHCFECHGARNALGALSQAPGAGGNVLPGDLWLAPALNDPQGASVAAWSEAELVRFLQTGRNSSTQANGPMGEVVLHGTQYLSPGDAQAMAVYLRSLPQRPPAPQAAPAQAASNTLQQGAKLYETHCADCHGATGQGQPGAYPALAGNRKVTQALPNNLINTLLAGGFAPATPGQPRPFGMPPFKLRLSDAQMAAVLSHIRSAWGNRAAAVSEFDINKFRRSQAP